MSEYHKSVSNIEDLNGIRELKFAEELLESGACNEAVEYLERLNQKNPGKADCLAALANVLLIAEEVGRAERCFRELTVLESDRIDAWVGLAVARIRLNNRVGGREALCKVVELQPNNPDALRALADAYLADTNYEMASELYWAQLREKADDITILIKLGVCLFRAARFKAAGAIFDRALQLDPGHLVALENREAVELAQAVRRR